MLRYAIVIGFALSAFGQISDPSPTFEVASVKLAPPPAPNAGMSVGCNGGPGSKDPERWTCQNMSVSNLISTAYDLKRYQMPEGDNQPDRFNITAKLPPGATREQFRVMLQNLLKERFKLELHFEKKEVPGYELVVAKSGKLKEAAPPPDPDSLPPWPAGGMQKDKDGFPILPAGRQGMGIMNGRARWNAPNYTTAQIATFLGNQLNKPVVDATGLDGKYDVGMTWVSEGIMRAAGPDGAPPSELDAGPTLLMALQDQLGLKLQSKKVTIDYLIVDRIEKKPTEN